MLNDPRFTAEVELTIPFHDVDMMGVAWHGNYFRYFEVAREALLNQFNYGYRQMKESGYLWPVVDARVKYRHALTFEQRIRVRAHIEEFEKPSADWLSDFRCRNGQTRHHRIHHSGRSRRAKPRTVLCQPRYSV